MKRQSTPTLRRQLLAQSISYILFGVAVVKFWIAPLGSSFWRDEAGAVWTVKDGFSQMLVRTQDWPSISVAYGVVCRVAYLIAGANEYAFRLPSVFAISGAALLVYQLAKRLFDTESAFPAVVVFICSETVIFAGCDARPYSLLLLTVAASTLLLVRWLGSGGLWNAIGYVITAALVVHVQYLGFPVLGVHAAYAFARMRGGPVHPKGLLFGAASIGLLLAPLIPAFLHLIHTRQAHSFVARPNLIDLASVFAPPVLLSGIGAGLVIAKLVSGPLSASYPRVANSTLILSAGLAIVPVFLLFGISILTSVQVFIPRYFIESQIGVALLVGWAIGRLRPAIAPWILTASIMLCSITVFGSLTKLHPIHGHEDWRGAMAAVRAVARDSSIPVLIQSGFIESSTQKLDFTDTRSFMTAPLSIYPAAGRELVIPYRFDERSQRYVESTVVPILEHGDRFILVTCSGFLWPAWFAGRFQEYSYYSLGNFENVAVTVFELDKVSK